MLKILTIMIASPLSQEGKCENRIVRRKDDTERNTKHIPTFMGSFTSPLYQMARISGSIKDLSVPKHASNVTTCLVELRPLSSHSRSQLFNYLQDSSFAGLGKIFIRRGEILSRRFPSQRVESVPS